MKDLCELFARAEATRMWVGGEDAPPHVVRQPWAELDPTCDWSFGRVADAD